ncbi:hypothetical protein F5X99DRAFT_404824 [Biscogniauxia marginata]|nr:hypothetical protein F5X99DRAFT_404824 [Biscogniauxia marginata]
MSKAVPKHHKGSSRPSKSAKVPGGHSSGSEAGTSFIFVVNEIELNTNVPLTADHWGNFVPPDRQASYANETPGHVFEYHNGNVARSRDYFWYRPNGLGTEGSISYTSTVRDEYMNIIGNQIVTLDTYSATTVFDLGPFFPCAYALADATVQDLSEYDTPHDMFYALHFRHEAGGVSRAFFNGGAKYIAGSHASWLGSLVPEAYKNLDPNVPRSTALGGELGPLLGLMALAERPGRTDEAFSMHWNEHTWTGRRREPVSAHGPPRGVVVHVAVEPGRTGEEIERFEHYDYVVRG